MKEHLFNKGLQPCSTWGTFKRVPTSPPTKKKVDDIRTKLIANQIHILYLKNKQHFNKSSHKIEIDIYAEQSQRPYKDNNIQVYKL